MARHSGPLFLERQSYRRRRLGDAARMLPAAGALLWLLPLLWRGDAAGGADGIATGPALIWIFAVWLGLILTVAPVARALVRSPREEPPQGPPPALPPESLPEPLSESLSGPSVAPPPGPSSW